MGTFRERVSVSNPEKPSASVELEMVVDSGATYTWIPKDILLKLGIRPKVKRRFKLADGNIIEREAGIINLSLKEETLPNFTVFGDEGSELLLGAMTLEAFGLGIDPVNKTLVPVTLLLVLTLEVS